MLPNNEATISSPECLGARDNTGVRQLCMLQMGTYVDAMMMTQDVVRIGEDPNIPTFLQGPLRVGYGLDSHAAQINNIKVYTTNLTPRSIGMNTTAEEVYTVPGITASDTVIVMPPSSVAGIGIGGVRAGTDFVAINWVNASTGSLTPAAGTYRFLVFTALAQ
jgi:hypothetical protein